MPRVRPPSIEPSVKFEPWVADLHIHSKYSRACSRDLELENLAWWAQRKGVTLLGTGDFTHPGWFDHLCENLRPAEPGLFRLSPEREEHIARRLPPSVRSTVRFMLSVEISTIYKRDDRTRKVHHLIYLPDLGAVERFNSRLGHGPRGLGGNLGSDGRPILGLDSRDLLEITLESSPDGFLVPAHIWTPWFSALGSKSGFDAIADCYADLAGHVHAVETGLSSDPEMNWRVASLDRYQLVSNSDAHSPQALAREATTLTGELDYFSVKRALETGEGLHGTIEFFPEEGKYHADGHRACGVRWDPARTREAAGQCPECGKPLTVGVLHRVEELADRPLDYQAPDRPEVRHLIQLHEIVGEIQRVGAKSKSVESRVTHLVATLGSELDILSRVPIEEITRAGGELLGEAIARLRRGQVHRSPGYDGEYGVIRLFEVGELADPYGRRDSDALFDVPAPKVPQPRKDGQRKVTAPRARMPKSIDVVAPPPPITSAASPHRPWEPMLSGMEEVGTGLLDRLDALQRVAASAPGGPMLVVAGPGTGKTRTLTHRIAYLCADMHVKPDECLAITFTRRAAEEMRARLTALLGDAASQVTVATFHALGLSILRENAAAAGLSPGFAVADDQQRAAASDADPDGYVKALREHNLVDLDELIGLPVSLLRDDPELVEEYRSRWRWVFVDEYQDVDAAQYELLRLLVPADGNICAIGDPDQAIYSFRGADLAYFLRFAQDFVDSRIVRLTRNYRSTAPIVAAASQAIAPSSLVRGRRLEPARLDPDAPLLGLHAAASVSAEADWVARTIDELVGGLSHRSFDGSRVDSRASTQDVLSFADIAVLYRTDAQAAAVVDALTRASIPVQKRSHDRLMKRPAVAAIARELRFATVTPNGVAPSGADSSGSVPGAAGTAMIERVRAAGRLLAAGRPRLFEPDGAAPAVLAPNDVFSAVELLIPLAVRCGDDLESFLQALATGAEVDALDARAQAVTLLTLHAAKGLEWPVVFLIGCEDGLLPMRFPGTAPSEEAVAEERRLFFVGLTRAERRLFLSHAVRRIRHGAEYQPERTPFLDSVDPGLIERRGDVAEKTDLPRHRQLRLL